MTGYKFKTEIEAIEARRECAEFHGIPEGGNNGTMFWVNYSKATFNNCIFWYIIFDASIESVLGEPTNFEIDENKI